jgi:hypothetical protein
MELSKDTFAQIIKATASGVDWEQFGVEVATRRPDLFVEILSGLESEWKSEAQNMRDNGLDRVDIIKYVRNESRMTMKEAMHWVDNNLIQLDSDD